jgi:hypothetical protein
MATSVQKARLGKFPVSRAEPVLVRGLTARLKLRQMSTVSRDIIARGRQLLRSRISVRRGVTVPLHRSTMFLVISDITMTVRASTWRRTILTGARFARSEEHATPEASLQRTWLQLLAPPAITATQPMKIQKTA